MKKTAAILILTFATITSSSLKAQGVFNDPETDTYISQKSITPPDHGYTYTGSPYENKRFQQGFVFRDGLILASNVGLRYNAARDEFEIKKSLNTSNYAAKVLVKSPEIYVKIMNRLFIYMDEKEEEEIGGYYEVLYEGDKISLYKKVSKDFIEGKKAINSIAADILPQYKEKETLFLFNANKELVSLPSSRNGKINSLGSNKKELKKHIKDKNLNINKNYDLIKLLRFYDSL